VTGSSAVVSPFGTNARVSNAAGEPAGCGPTAPMYSGPALPGLEGERGVGVGEQHVVCA
jgi:hypothetical protein